MADKESAVDMTTWFPVIGKALAFLCLSKAMERDPKKYDEVLAKVKFLQGLGLSQKDAAQAAGSSAESVRVMRHQRKRTKNGKAKKKSRR